MEPNLLSAQSAAPSVLWMEDGGVGAAEVVAGTTLVQEN